MSGVIAYRAKNPKQWHFDIIARLMRNSASRGLHSFGMSYLRDGKVSTIKSSRIDDLVCLLGSTSFQESPPCALIFNNHYSTSGDHKQPSNNQPIVSVEQGETIALAFDGVVSQRFRVDWEEEFGRRYVTDNDGEVVLREFIERGPEAFRSWFIRQRFSFAGFVLSSRSGLWWVRNPKRPLWYSTLEGDGVTFWASTRDILKRSEVPGEYFEQQPYTLGGCPIVLEKIRKDSGMFTATAAV